MQLFDTSVLPGSYVWGLIFMESMRTLIHIICSLTPLTQKALFVTMKVISRQCVTEHFFKKVIQGYRRRWPIVFSLMTHDTKSPPQWSNIHFVFATTFVAKSLTQEKKRKKTILCSEFVIGKNWLQSYWTKTGQKNFMMWHMNLIVLFNSQNDQFILAVRFITKKSQFENTPKR